MYVKGILAVKIYDGALKWVTIKLSPAGNNKDTLRKVIFDVRQRKGHS